MQLIDILGIPFTFSMFTFLWYRCAKRYFLFPQKKVTKENSRLRLPLLLLVLLVGPVLTEPDDAGF
ncbi:hypothetical protein [Mucilaginibacter sp. L196]|uniref:hypothetical protein n=1 Tax=Mucilaginibacter sp. L196 TaxID=1641870 RepID=UPI00131A8381|nr:hypothetical protein [Mucilaginibacter sp. L196]